MKHLFVIPSAVLAILLVLALCPAASGQTMVDVRAYSPSGGSGGNSGLGASRPRIEDPLGGQRSASGRDAAGAARAGAGSRLPGGRAGPTGIPERGENRGSDAPDTTLGRTIYLAAHEVRVRIVDGVAITEIDQVFYNDANFDMEGTYMCPLPRNAVLNGFSIYMGNREVHGTVMERNEGREIYERITRRRKDPGIVEMMRGNRLIIQTRIFPIPGRGNMRVVTRYAHPLVRTQGQYLTQVPLKALGNNEAPPLKNLKFSVEANSTWPLRRVYSPDYAFEGLERGTREVWIGDFEATDFRPMRDLRIGCIPARTDPGLAVHLHTTAQGERFFMAAIASGDHSLSNIELSFDGAEAVDVYPKSARALHPGRQTLIFGRLAGTAPAVAVLKAHRGLRKIELRESVGSRNGFTGDTRFVAGLWAVQKVRDLMRTAGNAEPSDEAKQQIIALGVRHGILTPYTVFLSR